MRPDGTRLAFRTTGPATRVQVVFLPGFCSDMDGIKAQTLRRWAAAAGVCCVCFDYFGHGQSDGDYRDGTLSRWLEDALAVIDATGRAERLVLVGASMGGWLALLAARALHEAVSGVVLLAPAPDFTERVWESQGGGSSLPSRSLYCPAYGGGEYELRPALIEDARRHLLREARIAVPARVSVLHGLEDQEVPWQGSLELMNRLPAERSTLTLLHVDHRLSDAQALRWMLQAVQAAVDEAKGVDPSTPLS
ncbi:MAG TPA: alpha/beta hydrolase [Vicinamibacterales bacterium]|nr:alpha/beta hydrolase [Vicinamibacterales bacterium]